MTSSAEQEAADRLRLEQIIAEAKQCDAPLVASLFESASARILVEMAEARRLGDAARRKTSPFVYVMQ